MASSTTNLAISAMSYHSEERQLYSRMVRSLRLNPILSMETIAFWLSLQAKVSHNVIHSINSMDDITLLSTARPVLSFVEDLHRSVPVDDPRYPFRQDTARAIIFYLQQVCYKTLEDIRMDVEAERLAHQFAETNLNTVRHGERSRVLPTVVEAEREIKFVYPFNNVVYGHYPTAMAPMAKPDFGGVQYVNYGSNNVQMGVPYYNHLVVPQNVPREERTLFVTFSNGYPWTEGELYGYFMRNFGDVELVTVQKTKGGKLPLFGHVSFYSVTTLLRVLNGKMKVKFVVRGKHLWARRFYPRRN